jgi:hypothetical protein
MRLHAVALLLLSTAPAGAVEAYYETYAAGVNVIDVDAQFELAADRYRIQLDYRTVGALNLVMSGKQRFTADGRFISDRARPSRFFSSGVLRGDPRLTQIDYPDGQPQVRQLTPANEQEREPVQPAQQQGSIDTLSAMADLLHRVAATGRCDGRAVTFDGRRLSVLEARTAGTQVLEPSSRSVFAGPALRCDFVGRQTGGFMLNEDRERLLRPHEGSAWFATVNGVTMPVRMAFRTRWFGDATMYLAARPRS